jgi:hypothetical protein
VEKAVANDNRPIPLTKAEEDWQIAAKATRCLELLVAPDNEMVWEQAWERWRLVELAMNEVFGNVQSTVEQTVVALEVMAGWQQYWGRFHRNERERGRCLVAWMNTRAALKELKEQGNVH